MYSRHCFYLIWLITLFNIIVIYKRVWDGGGSGKTENSDFIRKLKNTAEVPTKHSRPTVGDLTDQNYHIQKSTMITHQTNSTRVTTPKLNFNRDSGLLDKWGLFRVHYFVLTGDKWKELGQKSTCLASQSSVDRLYWLPILGEKWKGPISIAVFVPDVEFTIANLLLSHLTHCFPTVAERISFSFIYPEDHPPKVTYMKTAKLATVMLIIKY